MSGRAFKYLTQPTRTDFNLRRDQERSHFERSAAKSKASAKLTVSFAPVSSTSLRLTRSTTRTQARQMLVPLVPRPSGAKYADNDCPAGRDRGQPRGWRVQARRWFAAAV